MYRRLGRPANANRAPCVMAQKEGTTVSDQGRIPGEALGSPGTASNRKAKRRKNLIVGSVVGGLVAVGAVVAILASAGGSRSGTLIGPTTTTVPSAAAKDYTSTCLDAAPVSGLVTTSQYDRIKGAGAVEFNRALLRTNVIPTGPFSFAPGFVVNSVVVDSTSAPYSGTAVVTVGRKLQLNMSMSVTDCKNFTLNVATSASSTTTVAAGLTLDPSTFTGSITVVNGTATWTLTGASKIWTLATGATLTTTPTIANSCPAGLSCPSGNDRAAYLSTNGTLVVTGLPSLNVTGAVRLGDGWALLQTTTSNPTALSFSMGTSSITINSPTLTIWKTATHQSNPNAPSSDLVMPDLSSITNGLNVEFCGTFQIATPITGDQATSGCAEWSPEGIVLAQSKNLNQASTTANSSATVNTNVKGVAWTNLPSTYTGVGGIATVSFSGVPTPTFPSTISMGGVSTLPGVVMAALGKPSEDFLVNVSGTFSATGFTVTGSVPVNFSITNSPPVAVKVTSIYATIRWDNVDGWGNLTIGGQSELTFGTSPNTSTATAGVALQFSRTGVSLTLTALGTKAAGDTTDGLTPATRLARPSQAQYLSTKWMGIDGLNLWSLTGSIGWGSDGLPTMSYTTSTYLNPTGATTQQFIKCSTSTCGDADWMVSTVIVSAGVDNTCFAYTFDGTDPSGGAATLSLNGGVIKTSKFALGASASGCTVGGITLPAGFAGLKFSATIGSTSLDLTLTYSVTKGFCYAQNIGNLTLLGVTYNQVNLSVSMVPTGSSATCGKNSVGSDITNSGGTKTSFYGQWTVPKVGTMSVDADMGASSTGGIQASLYAKLPTLTSNDADFALSNVAFGGSFLADSSGCGYIDTSATGSLKMKSKVYALNGFELKIGCNGLQKFLFDFTFSHSVGGTTKTTSMYFKYDSATFTMNGSFSYTTDEGSWKIGSDAGKYKLNATLSFTSDWGAATPTGSFSLKFQGTGSGDLTAADYYVDGSGTATLSWGAGSTDYGGSASVKIRITTNGCPSCYMKDIYFSTSV